MGATASLSSTSLAVDPGAEATCEVKIRNTGTVVDQFTVDVMGDTKEWAVIEPPSLSLFPNAEGTVKVTFKPPRSFKTKAGEAPFAVRAWSKEDPEGSVVEEGVLTVGSFVEAAAELLPRTARGRRRAKHELVIDNKGNKPVDAQISVFDPDNLLAFDVPPSVVAQPGTATFTPLIAKPSKTFVKGPPKTIPFQVVVTAEGQDDPITTDGAMLQESLLPKWFFPALLALLALLIILFVMWQTLFKPVVESAARDAVVEEIEEVDNKADLAAAQAEQASQQAEEAIEAAGGGSGSGGDGSGGDGSGSGGGGGSGGINASGTDFRITTDSAPNDLAASPDFDTFTFTVPADRIFSISDIVFQNPRGDSGTIRVQRGSDVLLEIGLNNFRDLDYHFVEPIQFQAGQQVTLAVDCRNTTGTNCSPSAYFSGTALNVAG